MCLVHVLWVEGGFELFVQFEVEVVFLVLEGDFGEFRDGKVEGVGSEGVCVWCVSKDLVVCGCAV